MTAIGDAFDAFVFFGATGDLALGWHTPTTAATARGAA